MAPKIRIQRIPESQIDPKGGSFKRGTKIIKHMTTGEDVQEDWEKDHGPLDEPTFLRNQKNQNTGSGENKG